MVFKSILQDQETAGWRPVVGEPFSTPDTNELVVFEAYFIRGFGIPAHPFLAETLCFLQEWMCRNPKPTNEISLEYNKFIGIEGRE